MSKIVKTHGIVIHSVDYLDNDKILTVLTSDLGKISVMAKGARKKGKFSFATEVFVLSSMVLFKGTKMYHLNEAVVIEQYYNLRLDYDKLLCANEIIKFANSYLVENSNIEESLEYEKLKEYNEIFKLTCIALFSIIERDRYELILASYIIRMLKIVGFVIDFAKIDKEEEIDFEGIFANKVGSSTKYIYIETENIYVIRDVYNIVKYIHTCNCEKVFNFKTNLEKEANLIEFKNIYLNNHI